MPATVCTPLRTEQLALRGAVSVPVQRTGRGPGGSWPAPSRKGSGGLAGGTLVAGVAGALVGDLRPGDIVVADEVRQGQDSIACPVAPLLVGALRRQGLPVRTGPVLTTSTVVAGPDRTALARSGLAVDTESAFLGRGVAPGRLAVLRTVVDTPDHPLLRPGTVWRGLRALRMLRRTAPVIDQWARATGDREVLLGGPVTDHLHLRDLARESDLVLVLGSATPADTRLVERAESDGVEAHLVEDPESVDLRWLAGVRRLALIRGALAPPHLADDVVTCLTGLGRVTVREVAVAEQDVPFQLPKEVV